MEPTSQGSEEYGSEPLVQALNTMIGEVGAATPESLEFNISTYCTVPTSGSVQAFTDKLYDSDPLKMYENIMRNL